MFGECHKIFILNKYSFTFLSMWKDDNQVLTLNLISDSASKVIQHILIMS